jgi:hypothetical protein
MLKKSVSPIFTGLVFLYAKTVAQERKNNKRNRTIQLMEWKYFENTILKLKTRMEILSKKDSLN